MTTERAPPGASHQADAGPRRRRGRHVPSAAAACHRALKPLSLYIFFIENRGNAADKNQGSTRRSMSCLGRSSNGAGSAMRHGRPVRDGRPARRARCQKLRSGRDRVSTGSSSPSATSGCGCAASRTAPFALTARAIGSALARRSRTTSPPWPGRASTPCGRIRRRHRGCFCGGRRPDRIQLPDRSA